MFKKFLFAWAISILLVYCGAAYGAQSSPTRGKRIEAKRTVRQTAVETRASPALAYPALINEWESTSAVIAAALGFFVGIIVLHFFRSQRVSPSRFDSKKIEFPPIETYWSGGEWKARSINQKKGGAISPGAWHSARKRS